MNKLQRTVLIVFGTIILFIQVRSIVANGEPEGAFWSISIFLGAVLVASGLYRLEFDKSSRRRFIIFSLCAVILIISTFVGISAYGTYAKPKRVSYDEAIEQLKGSLTPQERAIGAIVTDCEILFRKAISPEYKRSDFATEQVPLDFYSLSSDGRSSAFIGNRKSKYALYEKLEIKSYELKSLPDKESPFMDSEGVYHYPLTGTVETKQEFLINFKATCIGRLKSDRSYHVEIEVDRMF